MKWGGAGSAVEAADVAKAASASAEDKARIASEVGLKWGLFYFSCHPAIKNIF